MKFKKVHVSIENWFWKMLQKNFHITLFYNIIVYLMIIPPARVACEMIIDEARSVAMIISYPASGSGIIVLLKTPPKYRKLNSNKNKIMYGVRFECTRILWRGG